MKKLFIITLLVSSCFAEYQAGKIDMHGGKDSYLYDKKKSAFGKKNMGMLMIRDKNATKKAARTETKK